MSLRLGCCLALVLLAPPASAAPAAPTTTRAVRLEPRFTRLPGELRLTLPPIVIADPAVARHLGSGLTTTFVIRLEARDASRRRAIGVSRIDVRLELWDEQYLATAFGVDGQIFGTPLQRLTGFEALERYFDQLQLPALRTVELDPRAPWALDLRLDVLPFSLAEQRDAQRWFSDTVASQRSAAGEVGGGGGEENRGLGSLLDLVMATSLERRAVTSFTWTATLGAGIQ